MPEHGESLSERELEVLKWVVGGASNKEIALKLTISQNTVKVHLRNIFTKLGVASRTEATTSAIQLGLVAIPGATLAPAVQEPEETPSERAFPGEVESSRPLDSLRGRRILYLLIPLTLVVLLVISLILRNLDSGPDGIAESFVEAPVGDSGWFEDKALPKARTRSAVAAVGLRLYQIGGESPDGIEERVDVYDTSTHTWLEAAEKPTAVADVTAAVLFGEIYVPGGHVRNGKPTDIVEAYSPANDTWRRVASLPGPTAGTLALSDGSFLYAIGGWDGEEYLDTNYVYDAGADSWRPLPPLPHARAFAAGSALTGQLFVVGGTDGLSELARCDSYDPAGGVWSQCPDMLLPRVAPGAAVVLNKLYVIGGGVNAEDDVSFSEVYDPNSETWQVVNTPMLSETPSWAYPGVANVEVRIYAIGGSRGEMLLSSNYIYAPAVYKTFIPAASSGAGN